MINDYVLGHLSHDLGDWVSNLINPSFSPDLYKEGKEKVMGVGRKTGRILCKKFTKKY